MSKKIYIINVFIFILATAVLIRSSISSTEPVLAEEVICQQPINIIFPAAGMTLSNVVPVELAGGTDIVSVRYKLNGNLIGRGFPDPVSGSQWRMLWDTRYSESDDYDLTATVRLTSGLICTTSPFNVNVNNSTQLNLDAILNPPAWSGLTNSVAIFNIDYPVSAGGSTPDIAKYADVFWSVSGRGTIAPELNSNARYNSGPEGGGGTVKARIKYGGQEIQIESPTNVIQQNSTPDDDPNSDSASSTGDESTEDETDTEVESDSSNDEVETDENVVQVQSFDTPKEAITQIIEEDNFTKVCLTNKLGEGKVEELIQQNRRPRSDEFNAFYSCFARQRYVLPSILAPVAPEEIVSKPESEKLRINTISNQTKTNVSDDSDLIIMVLSGQAAPNSTVLLYIFSEPLVLVTTADDEGNWTYTLEDPLESGNHEVYALVDRGDGEYERSSITSFVVGQASASAENPNGYSLALIEEPTVEVDNQSINIFLAATIGIVGFASAILLLIFTKNRHHKKAKLLNSQTNITIEPAPAQNQSPSIEDNEQV